MGNYVPGKIEGKNIENWELKDGKIKYSSKKRVTYYLKKGK